METGFSARPGEQNQHTMETKDHHIAKHRPAGAPRNGSDRRREESSATMVAGRAPSRSASYAKAAEMPSYVQAIVDATPSGMVGVDRMRHQAEQFSKVDARDRAVLRRFMDSFLARMSVANASDVDMGGPSSGGFIWFRIDGEKRPDLNIPRFSIDETNIMIMSLLSRRGMKSLIDRNAADFSYELASTAGQRQQRFRATAYLDMGHLALNMRAITADIRSLKSLAFHPTIEKGLKFRHVRDGLTLITGVTGSGKSTTLDSIIDANNDDVHGHIVVIGRPIEYVHESRKCIIRHREVGQDVPTFKDGIVQALRQDPDIVVIGEMRDPETISAGLEITDSGHKVFSTLHTSSAVESIDRIIAEYPAEEQNRVRTRLADVLRCIVSQKLLPKVGGGRILAKEVLWMTPPARAAIKNNNTNEIYQMMWEGWNIGQITLEQDLYRLMRQGLITPDVAMDHANNKRRFQQLAK